VSTYAALAHTCWVGGYDLGPDLNTMQMPIEYEELDDSRFGMTGRSRIAGVEDVSASLAGYLQLGTGLVEDAMWSARSTVREPVTMSKDGTATQVAWFFMGRQFKLTSIGGQHGAVAPFQVDIKGVRSGASALAAGAVRGNILKAKGTISATGATGSVAQVGAVGSGQYLYAVVNTFAIGTSFTLQIQSDDNSGMTSPTTRMTIGSITAVGGTWATRVAGPIVDDWWRVNVSAVSGTSTIAVSVGIK
jgi:hypothetical protein